MNVILLIAVLVCTALALVLGILYRRLSAASDVPVTLDRINELSVERYRPMVHLLHDRDLLFMRTQQGYTRQAEAKLRVQRYHVFRGYLQCLERDFDRTCGALKLLMTRAGQDRPDLAETLVRRQFAFECGVMAIRFRLVLYRYVWIGVDASDLVGLFDLNRLELQTLIPAVLPSPA